MVFHPFLDEILIGKIKGCSPEGVHGNGPDSSDQTWEHSGACGWGCGQASRPPFSFCAGPRGQGSSQIQKQNVPVVSEKLVSENTQPPLAFL